MYDFYEADERDPKPAEWHRAPRMAFRAAVVLGMMAALAFLALIVMAAQAGAHEATSASGQPMGWSYPANCCSLRDCRPAKDSEVRETRTGYLLTSTGEMVSYGDKRIKDAPDGLFHVCQQGGNFDSGRILCLFIPPRSY